MARADSTIRVSIIGDAKKLVGAIGDADKASGGLLKSAAVGLGGALVALKAVDAGFDFVKESLGEFDRLGDAGERLNITLGLMSGPLKETADQFHKIGASTADMLELEADFAGLATSVGITNAQLSLTSERAAAIATAISLLQDVDPTTVIDQIAKAADGNKKAMQALEISVTDADIALLALRMTGKENEKELTKNELAAARLQLVLDALQPKLNSAANATGDLEIEQKRAGAAVEDLQAKLGEKLAPALVTVLQFINDEIEALPHAIQGFQNLGAAIEGFGRTALGPLGNVADALRNIIGLFDNGQRAFQVSTGRAPRSEKNTVQDTNNFNDRNGNTTTNRIGGP